jgi:hypothetical protein
MAWVCICMPLARGASGLMRVAALPLPDSIRTQHAQHREDDHSSNVLMFPHRWCQAPRSGSTSRVCAGRDLHCGSLCSLPSEVRASCCCCLQSSSCTLSLQLDDAPEVHQVRPILVNINDCSVPTCNVTGGHTSCSSLIQAVMQPCARPVQRHHHPRWHQLPAKRGTQPT